MNYKMITFKTTSHPHFEKRKLWFVIVFTILLAFVGLFVYLKQYVSSLVFVVLGLVIYIYSKMPAKEITCTISNEGIKIGERVYGKERLKSFWISELLFPPVLHLELNQRFYFPVSVSLGRQPIEPIKRILLEYLPEQIKPFWDVQDKLARLLRL